MSSSLVRSAPRARAMVDRRCMAFRRSRTSSCCEQEESKGSVKARRHLRNCTRQLGRDDCGPMVAVEAGAVWTGHVELLTLSSSMRTAMG